MASFIVRTLGVAPLAFTTSLVVNCSSISGAVAQTRADSIA